MGGKRKFNKFAQRKRDRKEEAKNPRLKPDVRKDYADIVKNNQSFETYYKTQGICKTEEWDMFYSKMQECLPTAFRVTGSREEAGVLLRLMQGQLFSQILGEGTEEEIEAKKPVCLPWYPGGLAWQLQLTRTDIRRSEAYYRLHNFLTAETASGSISRQEAVSMIPPILLGVLPHHKVLDMCASPGSKTAQLIEFLHAGDDTKMPTGFVMANDVDNSRCYMLVHQAKRLNSPCIVITNHDATTLPHLVIGDSWVESTPQNGKETDEIKSEEIAKTELHSSKETPDSADATSDKETTSADSVKVVSSETPGCRLLKFDRILCDVPCSGDGTLRKNSDIWLKWSAGQGNNLHGVQYRIGHRGLELLTVGGRLVYSTCSLNPVECEAVIHRLLKEAKGALRLLDVAHMLPGLRFSKGMTKWKLATKDLEFFDKFEDVPEKYTTMLRPQMFPPTEEENKVHCLEKCIRILPHQQDTGAFFVALLEKTAPMHFEKKERLETVPADTVQEFVEVPSAPWGPQRKGKRFGGYKEDPYVFFSGETEDVFPSIKEFYQLRSDFDPTCLLTRCRVGKKKNIYFVSPIVKDVVMKNEGKLKIINTGVKTFVRCDNKNMSCAFRLSQEGLGSVLPYIGKTRHVQLEREDLVLLLLNDDPHSCPDVSELTPSTMKQVQNLEHGSCVLLYEEKELRLQLVGWRGARSLRAYTARPDTVHMLRLLGEDVSKFDVNKFKKIEEGSTITEDTIPDDITEDGSVDISETDQEMASKKQKIEEVTDCTSIENSEVL